MFMAACQEMEGGDHTWLRLSFTKTSLLMMLFVVSSVPFLEVALCKNTASVNSTKSQAFAES